MPASLATVPMASRIELWPLDRLIPYARNARTHSDAQVAQVMASIREFGFTNPILVDSRDGIIAGHCRLLAARKLGLPEVPVIVLDHLTDAQRRAYILADNRLALSAGWDEEMLAIELGDLKALDFDLDLTGFDTSEIDRLLLPAASAEEDAVPEVPAEPVSRLGDLWLCGAHRVMAGDSTDAATVAILLGGQKPPFLMATDPPYGVEYDPTWRDGVGAFGKHEAFGKNDAGRVKQRGKVANDDQADWSAAYRHFPGRKYALYASCHKEST